MKIAYLRPDGGVSVIIPAIADMDEVRKAIPADAVATLETNALPSRAYRDAWTLSGGAVKHDMAKARAMKMEEIRKARDARLAATDGPFMRAQEQVKPPEVAALKTQRQALRDLPATVDLSGITNADALFAFEPVWP